MAEGKKFLGYGQVPEMALNDVFITIDVSDTADSPEGSTRYGTNAQLIQFVNKYANKSVAEVYETITDLIADQSNQLPGNIYLVVDASLDPAVASGPGYYNYLGTTDEDLGDYQILSTTEVAIVEDGEDWDVRNVKLKSTNIEDYSGLDLGLIYFETDNTNINRIIFDASYTQVLETTKTQIGNNKTFYFNIYNATKNTHVKAYISTVTSVNSDTNYSVNVSNVLDAEIDLQDVLHLGLPIEYGGGKVKISNLLFQLTKNKTIPNNNDDTLEVGDIIKGFIPNGDFIEAKYLGGDITDFENETIYNIFNGI